MMTEILIKLFHDDAISSNKDVTEAFDKFKKQTHQNSSVVDEWKGRAKGKIIFNMKI